MCGRDEGMADDAAERKLAFEKGKDAYEHGATLFENPFGQRKNEGIHSLSYSWRSGFESLQERDRLVRWHAYHDDCMNRRQTYEKLKLEFETAKA